MAGFIDYANGEEALGYTDDDESNEEEGSGGEPESEYSGFEFSGDDGC